MRMVLVMYAGATPTRVSGLLDRFQAEGYTELPGARGSGQTGPRRGTRAWPGESTVFFSIVPRDEATPLVDALAAEARQLPEGERLHVAVLPVEFVI